MSYGLTDDDLIRIIEVFSKFNEIDEVIIYGSRAKGNFKPYSDIDITFVGKDLNLKIINEIAIVLDDLMLPYTFDTSIWSQISNADLIAHINRIGKTLYQKIS